MLSAPAYTTSLPASRAVWASGDVVQPFSHGISLALCSRDLTRKKGPILCDMSPSYRLRRTTLSMRSIGDDGLVDAWRLVRVFNAPCSLRFVVLRLSCATFCDPPYQLLHMDYHGHLSFAPDPQWAEDPFEW
jgi:hypothetical protein